MKLSPIKERVKERVSDEPKLTRQQFKYLINEIYSLMLDYSRLRGLRITKHSPILVGNVEFWFGTSESGDPQIQYNKQPSTWDEALMRSDIELHLHGLYFNQTN